MYPCSSTSTMCIPQEKFCDGHIDCEDKLDEVGCVSITYNRPTESSILNTYTHRPSNHRICKYKFNYCLLVINKKFNLHNQ